MARGDPHRRRSGPGRAVRPRAAAAVTRLWGRARVCVLWLCWQHRRVAGLWRQRRGLLGWPQPGPAAPQAAPGPWCLVDRSSRGSCSALPAVPRWLRAVPRCRLAFQDQDKQGAVPGCPAGARPGGAPFSAGQGRGVSAPPLFLYRIPCFRGGAAGFGPVLPRPAPVSVTLLSAMKSIVPLTSARLFPSHLQQGPASSLGRCHCCPFLPPRPGRASMGIPVPPCSGSQHSPS